MSEPAFGSGITLVAGPEQIPLSRVLDPVCAQGLPVLVAARSASHGRVDAELTWLAEPVDQLAIVAWVGAHRGPCTVVVESADCLGGWLAGERTELRLSRLLDALPRQAELRVLLLEPLPPSAIHAPDRAVRHLLARVDRTWLWTGTTRLRAQEVLGTGSVQHPGLPWDSRRGEGWFWAATAGLCAAAVAIVAFASGAGGMELLGSARESLPGSLWVDAWFSRQVFSGGSLSFSEMIGWPGGLDVLPRVGGLGAAAMALPFLKALGYPDFWNFSVAFALVANGLAAGWLARVAGAARGGALLAAVAYAVAHPVLREVGLGDQTVFWAAPLAIAIGLGLRALDGSPKDAVLAGIGIGIAGMFWWFYALFAAAVILSIALTRRVQAPALRFHLWARVGTATRAFLPFTIGLLPILGAWVRGDFFRMESFQAGGALSGRALVYFTHITTDVLRLDQLLGFPGSDPAWVLTVLVFAMIGAWLALHRGRRAFWALLVMVSAVLALGPFLDPAWGLSAGWLPLPMRVVQFVFPPAAQLDRPDRLLILTALSAVVLGAVLWRPLALRVGARVRGAAWILALGAILGTAASARVPTFSYTVPGWIRALDGEGAVLHVPMGLSDTALLWQPLHGHPISGGPDEATLMAEGTPYRLTYEQNPALAYFWKFSNGRLGTDERSWLLSHGARYVVIYQDAVLRLAEADPYLMPLVDRMEEALSPAIYDVEGVRVYRIESGL